MAFFKKKSIVLILFFALFIYEIYGGPLYLQVNNGHNGKITQVVYSKGSKLLFSAGNDGTVRVWNVEKSVELACVRISYLPVKMLAVDSNSSVVAVVSSNEISIFELSVWDWKSGKMLFSMALKSMPLYMGFSSKGSYLVYTLPRWKSINVLDPSTGTVSNYFNKSFGIVSFVTFSTSENNILTYQPSGVLTYWDFRMSSEIKKLFSVPNLSKICISNNKRFLVAKQSDRLVMVDLLTGRLLDSVEVKNIVSISISPGDSEVACISSDGDEVEKLEKFMIVNDGFLKISEEEERGITAIAYGDNGLFKGYVNGSIDEILPGEVTKVITKDRLANVSDFIVDKNGLILVTPEKLYEMESDYFNENSASALVNSNFRVSFREYDNPLGYKSGISRLDGKRIVIWGKGKGTEEFVVFNLKTGAVDFKEENFESPLVYVGTSKDWIITIEDSGRCSIYDAKSFQEKYSYFIPGIHKLIPVTESNMVGAKSKLGNFDSSLTLLSVETGENFPINDTSLYIYELAFSEESRLLYSIGIEKANSKLYTVLKSHFGDNFSSEYVLDRFEGEDIGASLSIDRDTGILYSSLGYTGIKGYRGSEIIKFEKSDKIARKIKYYNGRVYSLNRDRTLTIWDVWKRRPVLDFYLFKDEQWLVVLKEWEGGSPRGFYSSSGALKYINVIKDGYLINNYRELYRRKFSSNGNSSPSHPSVGGFDYSY